MSIWPQLNQKGKGFTLIEILVGVSLSLLLLGSLYGVYVTSYRAYRRNVDKSELNQNARIALERITRDLRQTERITTPLPPDDQDPTNPPPSEIMFQDGHNTETIQYIKYRLDSGNLYRDLIHYSFSNDPDTWVSWNSQDSEGNPPEEEIDESVVKADKINSLKFFGTKLITIQIKVEGNNLSYDYQTQTLGRNIQ